MFCISACYNRFFFLLIFIKRFLSLFVIWLFTKLCLSLFVFFYLFLSDYIADLFIFPFFSNAPENGRWTSIIYRDGFQCCSRVYGWINFVDVNGIPGEHLRGVPWRSFIFAIIIINSSRYFVPSASKHSTVAELSLELYQLKCSISN